MSTVTGTSSLAPAPTLTLFLLHRWDVAEDYRTHYTTKEAAEAALVAFVRANWDDIRIRGRGRVSHHDLSDVEAIHAYYDGTVDPDDNTSGTVFRGAVADSHSEDGFEILEVPIFGPGPDSVTLRGGTLRVGDRPGSVDPVTYYFDVAGLTVAVTPGPEGFPTVVVTPQHHLTGVPLTFRVEDSAEGEVFERICVAS